MQRNAIEDVAVATSDPHPKSISTGSSQIGAGRGAGTTSSIWGCCSYTGASHTVAG
jgi:hypothetical protein